MVEMALVLGLMLFLIMGFFDLYAFAKQDLLATMAIAQGAQAAAMGLPDDKAIEHTVRVSQGVLQKERVTVTPCTMRLAGSTATVSSDLYLVPLTPLYAQFWEAIGRLGKPLTYATTLAVVVPCWSL